MKNGRSREGYLLIDNQNSPGVTREFVGRSGVDAPAVGASTLYESSTMTCAHCQHIIILNPDRSRPRNYCRSCDQDICDQCGVIAQIHGCRPFTAVIDRLAEHIIRRN